MRSSDSLAENLSTYFEFMDLTSNGVAQANNLSQKTVWVCCNGAVVPSVNTAQAVCDAVGLDPGIVSRKAYPADKLKNSKRVGEIVDKLMLLDVQQLRIINSMVDGLLDK